LTYCSQKFWWLTVEPERRTVSSCCAATPQRVNSTTIDLFNISEFKQDRQNMLEGNQVSSCEATCWQAERQGRISRRLVMHSDQVTHTDIECLPTTLHIVLGSDCNLTCSYCCKQYSTAWLRDIENNGVYLDQERFRLNIDDKIVSKLGQKAIKESNPYLEILNSAMQYKNADTIEITGGEPFLYNGLVDIVSEFRYSNIFTGLGVNSSRFRKILDQLPRNTMLTVSAENTEDLYEFNRYGNTWSQFQDNLKTITELGFDYQFCSVISNTTIQGFRQFLDWCGDRKIIINPCSDPEYQSASVLDNETKKLVNSCKYDRYDDIVKQCINADTNNHQINQFRQYITEFAKRRALSFDAFPQSFQKWIN
jgi:organic radical activating enzyme